MKRKIILASTSPRRKDLMTEAGIPFEAVAPDYEEDMTLSMVPKELVKHLALGKAQSIRDRYPDAVIISGDTFIVHGDQVLGKPHTPERARQTLTMLSGTVHQIITGLAVLDTKNGREVTRVVEADVYFKDLTDEEIEAYIATGEPLDRAGAYAAQGLGGELIEKTEGDWASIKGLPIDAVKEILAELGVEY
jgi:septum formation protein